MSNPNITNVRVLDLRFPTSRLQIGSDAVNTDPDYSAAYCILETDVGVEGYGLAFTLGHGTELCVLALEYLAQFVTGRNLSSLTDDTVAFSRQLSVEADGRSVGEFLHGLGIPITVARRIGQHTPPTPAQRCTSIRPAQCVTILKEMD